MISRIEISSRQYEVADDIKKYVTKKIGRLDRLAPKHARDSMHADIKLVERKTKSDKYECEVVMYLPEQQITAKAATVNMFAAVDIVEMKLKNQLKKYKDSHGGNKKDHRSKLRQLLRRKQPAE